MVIRSPESRVTDGCELPTWSLSSSLAEQPVPLAARPSHQSLTAAILNDQCKIPCRGGELSHPLSRKPVWPTLSKEKNMGPVGLSEDVMHGRICRDVVSEDTEQLLLGFRWLFRLFLVLRHSQVP